MTIEKFRKWLKGLEWDDEFMRAVRSEVGSRNAKRATPHAGPGRPKGTKNRKGHQAGRPRLKNVVTPVGKMILKEKS